MVSPIILSGLFQRGMEWCGERKRRGAEGAHRVAMPEPRVHTVQLRRRGAMASLLSRREELRALRLARSQPESAGEFQELIEEIIERTVQMVLSDERIRARLEGVR